MEKAGILRRESFKAKAQETAGCRNAPELLTHHTAWVPASGTPPAHLWARCSLTGGVAPQNAGLPLLERQQDAVRVVHLLYSTSETGTLRHLPYGTRLTQLQLLRAYCLLFFFSFFFLPAHQPPTVGPRICPILYQSSLSHLRLWAERLWTAFCFAGLEHRDNSMWSDEPRGDTREVALQLPAGLVLVATELWSSFVLVFLGSPDPVHPNPQFSLSKKAQHNISWHQEERYRATRTMQPKAKLQEKPLSLAFRKDTGFSGLLKLRHSHSAIKYSPFYAAKQSLQLSPRMAPKGRDTHT